MPPHQTDQRNAANRNMRVHASPEESIHQHKESFRTTTKVSGSPEEVQVHSVQLKPSLSIDSQRIYQNNSSVSIGSPRSVFVPVTQSPQHKSVRQSPNLPTANDLKSGGVLSKWQNMEKNNKKNAKLKNKPIDYRFKPIAMKDAEEVVEKDDKVKKEDPFPNIQKSALSTRARKRKHVPFTFITINDDASSVSEISCVSEEHYDVEAVDALYNFAEKYQDTTIEAHKALLQETNELIQRISRHNLDAVDTSANPKDGTMMTTNTEKTATIDKTKLLEDTEHLLDEVGEIPLPPKIAASDKTFGQNSGPHLAQPHKSSILELMEQELTPVDQRQDLPSDFDEFGIDNDLSFDDLRDDPSGENNDRDDIERAGNDPAPLEFGKTEVFFSDDEGLSLMSANNHEAHDVDAIEKGHVANVVEKFTKNKQIGGHNEKEDNKRILQNASTKETEESAISSSVADLIAMMNPRMEEKANVKIGVLKSNSINGVSRISNRFQNEEEKNHKTETKSDEDSERGGIATLIRNIESRGKGGTSTQLKDERIRSDSPPVKEIFIPTIRRDSGPSFQSDTIKMSVRPLRPRTREKTRVRNKQEIDTRIQSIVRRGKDRFLNRWNRKKIQATE